MNISINDSEKPYLISIVIITLQTFSSLIVLLNTFGNSLNVLLGIPIFVSGILSCIGSFLILKDENKFDSSKKIAAAIINFGMAILFFGILILNSLNN